MPAQLDDPTTPIHYRRSGVMPYPTAATPMPPGIVPCEVTLRDGSKASIFPFNSPSQLPASLVQSVCDTLGRAILDGNTYPMLEPLPLEVFAPYWFGVFGVVMLQGDVESGRQMLERGMQGNGSVDWDGLCLGSFYTKPNYPGRSSHVCNAGFLVAEMARGKGVGRTMGEQYLDWAPKLGYSYSVFNLVYETNVASCKIWDTLGFERIGRVPGCGDLRTSPGKLVDSIVYGRNLGKVGAEVNRSKSASSPEDLASATIV